MFVAFAKIKYCRHEFLQKLLPPPLKLCLIGVNGMMGAHRRHPGMFPPINYVAISSFKIELQLSQYPEPVL